MLEGIITAVIITYADNTDGKYLTQLVEKSRAAGINVEEKNEKLKTSSGYVNEEPSDMQTMQIQGAAAFFAANLKIIIKLISKNREC